MSLVQTEAILLKKFKYGETSLIANFFSEDFGKFSAVIKGARNFKSGKSAIYQSMNKMTLIFNKKDNRELQIITKADLTDSYEGLKTDLEKIYTGFRILDLTNRLFIEYDKNFETYGLLVNVLKKIELSANNVKCYLIYFQLRIAEYTGISVFGDRKTGTFLNNFLINDETFVNNASFKNIDMYMDILFKINLSDLNGVGQLTFYEKDMDFISEYLDGYLLQDSFVKELKSTKTINQMKRFN